MLPVSELYERLNDVLMLPVSELYERINDALVFLVLVVDVQSQTLQDPQIILQFLVTKHWLFYTQLGLIRKSASNYA